MANSAKIQIEEGRGVNAVVDRPTFRAVEEIYHWWCITCGEDWLGSLSFFSCPTCYGEHTVGDLIKGEEHECNNSPEGSTKEGDQKGADYP